MTKFETLKDGTTVLLREPTMEDFDTSINFFNNLPQEDRQYLRVDVTRREIVERRIRQAESGAVYRLWAFEDSEVAGDGSVEFSDDLWRGHIGEVRVIISSRHKQNGMASLLIRELFHFCEKKGMEKVVCTLLGPQQSAIAVCEKLGFRTETVIEDYVKDLNGDFQSLIIMSCTLSEWFRQMKDFYNDEHCFGG